MHVVLVNDYACVNGGASQVALTSAVELAKRGVKVTLFAPVGPVAPELQGLPNLEVVCLGQHEILKDPNRLRAAVHGLWNRPVARALAAELDRHRGKRVAVHFHGWTKAVSSSGIRAAVISGLPVILTLHDYFPACPNGAFFNHQKRQICHLRPLGFRCLMSHCDSRSYHHKVWRVVRQVVQRRLGGVPSSIPNFISISKLGLEILRPGLPPNARVFPVANPISMSRMEPVAVARNERLVFVGRLAPEKGPDLLAQAARQLDIPVTFVGDGELRQRVTELNPAARITGWADRATVTASLREARALVFPSRWYETQGLVVYEAAALGIPSIVPNPSAAMEMVDPGINGLWFKSGDLPDLVAKIRELWEPTVAQRMGAEAYQRFWANCPTAERHAAELELVYRTILDGKSGPANPRS